MYNFTCVDLDDGQGLNKTRTSYNTFWYLDQDSLGNITDITFNEKNSQAKDLQDLKKGLQNQSMGGGKTLWDGFNDHVSLNVIINLYNLNKLGRFPYF